ncbi:hypothetical protein [Ligilactobacillus salivarius]|uniref:hypothetical protein n=1 Tax=Ligilactobacillus salivarius TaxID=1624 RepID=UPI0030F85FBF
MRKKYFKNDEVIPYKSISATPTPKLQNTRIIESKTGTAIINGIPQSTYTENPQDNIYGILQNPITKEKWYSLNKVVNIINGNEKYDDDGRKIHPIFVDLVGLKKKKSRDVVLKKAHQINNNDYIKIYRNDGEIYVHENLRNSLIKYYKNEISNLTSKKSSSLKELSLIGFKNILVDIVKNDRIRKNNNKRNTDEKLQIIDELKILNKNASPDLLDSVYNEIIDIIIQNDTARNGYISNRIETEFKRAINTKEKSDEYTRKVMSLYNDAFEDLYSKVIGAIRVRGDVGDAMARQQEFRRQKELYHGGIKNPKVANRVFKDAERIKKNLDENYQRLSEDYYLN